MIDADRIYLIKCDLRELLNSVERGDCSKEACIQQIVDMMCLETNIVSSKENHNHKTGA